MDSERSEQASARGRWGVSDDSLTDDDLAELKTRWAKLYTHPIARLITDYERLQAENKRLRMPIVGLQGITQQREEARAKALHWETEWLSEHDRADLLQRQLTNEHELRRYFQGHADDTVLTAALGQASDEHARAERLAALLAGAQRLSKLWREYGTDPKSNGDQWDKCRVQCANELDAALADVRAND